MTQAEVIAMRTTGAGLSRQGEYWTEKERKLLDEYFYSGVGLTDIALQLQRAETAIVQQLVNSKAFENERPKRMRTAEAYPCPCAKCDRKENCLFSLQNRDKIMCLIKEPANKKSSPK